MGTNEIVQKLEKLRKQRLLYGKIILACILINIPLLMFGSGIIFIVGIIVLIGGVVIFANLSGKVTEEYKKLYKENFVISILEEKFDDVIYDYKRGLEKNYVEQFGLTSMGNRFSSEDYIKGSYKGIGFEQSEVRIEHKGRNDDTASIYFRGRMIAFDFQFKDVKSVQAFSDNFPHRGTPKINYSMKKVQMENVDFNKKFDVLAADEVEAFYVMTPQLMEKVDCLKEKYENVALNFQGNKLYIGIWSGVDAFDGDISRPINYYDEKATIMSDVRVITDIIEVLGMMKEETK